MSMPGFTAEAALYGSSVHYRAVGTPRSPDRGEEVVPQFCYSPQPGVFCCWLPYTGWYCRRFPRVAA